MENISMSEKYKGEEVILTKDEKIFYQKVLMCMVKRNQDKLLFNSDNKNYSSILNEVTLLLKEKNLLDLFEKFKKKNSKILLENKSDEEKNIIYINLANAMLEVLKNNG